MRRRIGENQGGGEWDGGIAGEWLQVQPGAFDGQSQLLHEKEQLKSSLHGKEWGNCLDLAPVSLGLDA